MRDRLLGVQEGLHRREGPRLGHGRGALPHGGAGRSRQARIQDCPRARDDGGGAPARQRRQGLRSAGAARRRAPRVPSRQRVRSEQPPACGPCHGARPADCGADRSEPPAPEDRRDARAGAPDDAGADAQSRPRASRSTCTSRAASATCSSSSRTPPASTSPSPATTGIRRGTRSRSPASRSSRRCSRCCRRTRCSTRCSTSARSSSSPTPRRTGKYEEMVVRTFYLSHADAPGGRAAAERGDARAGRADGARLLAEQEPEHDHGPRVGAAGGDHGAAGRGQRPAAGRDHARRLDPGGQPGPREAVRARPERVYHHGHLLARSRRPSRSETDWGGQPGAAAVQPEHVSRGISAADFYLSVPPAIARFLETDTQTKLVAKPQLRGQEGQKITLNLGDEIPVANTTFGSHRRRRQPGDRRRSRRSTTRTSA